MKIAYSARHALHDPQFFLVRGRPQRSAEQPERATRLMDAIRPLGVEIAAPEDFGPSPRAAIHTPAYLDFLETAHERWQALGDASAEVLPNMHPLPGQPVTYPEGIVGRAGYHMADTACPIGAGTWAAAVEAAHSACQAAQWVIDGERAAYALCRPPGHHAYADRAGGFCFLNNSAIAAQYLLPKYGRVAILDVDVHHGNGTQGIFWHRRDVLTVSLHGDPAGFYPFFVGYAHERGEGDGLGYNINVPLPHGTGDDGYLAALARTARQIKAFAPGAVVVALGLDAYEGDPLKALAITTPGFARIGAAIAELGLPTVFVQEGGYLSAELGQNLASVLTGFRRAV
ncbi:acetylpolyamine amidohydrolase [Aliidongia dinghuensis]|uniref:Acetylpolyamine amidohydrolase n=1 Tax=Aliidongia dinghuensis TaxID=1867774 RepID=A0A8J2YZ47_9PROT|nr:histone deacetylase family protein [Aliidongia dinghuensis]GGF44476.1 acetylpolyamine amidohydrolase [Aliidongia dinghuensis]